MTRNRTVSTRCAPAGRALVFLLGAVVATTWAPIGIALMAWATYDAITAGRRRRRRLAVLQIEHEKRYGW